MFLKRNIPTSKLRKEKLSHSLPVYVLGVNVYVSLFLNTNGENLKGCNFILYICSSCTVRSSVIRDNLSPLVTCSKLIWGLSVRFTPLPKLIKPFVSF